MYPFIFIGRLVICTVKALDDLHSRIPQIGAGPRKDTCMA